VAGDHVAIDDAARGDMVAPPFDQRVAQLPGGVEVVDGRVGRQGRGAEALERGQRLGLAGADRAGQADERYALFADGSDAAG
jgi:hypothetical protein